MLQVPGLTWSFFNKRQRWVQKNLLLSSFICASEWGHFDSVLCCVFLADVFVLGIAERWWGDRRLEDMLKSKREGKRIIIEFFHMSILWFINCKIPINRCWKVKKKKKKKVLDFSIFFPPFIPAEGSGSWWELPADLNSRCSTPSSNYRYDTSVTQPRSWSESESSRKRLLTCPCLLTVVLLQQLHGSEQHGPVLRISDVQLVQVLLLQQLERVQVLIAVEQESGHVLLRDRDMWVEKPRMKVSKYALDLSHRTENKLRNQG